jgi:hypothetical protein
LPTSFNIFLQQIKIVLFHGPDDIQWNSLNIDDFLRRLATKLSTLVIHYSPVVEERLVRKKKEGRSRAGKDSPRKQETVIAAVLKKKDQCRRINVNSDAVI